MNMIPTFITRGTETTGFIVGEDGPDTLGIFDSAEWTGYVWIDEDSVAYFEDYELWGEAIFVAAARKQQPAVEPTLEERMIERIAEVQRPKRRFSF